jgi:hypothetical protein
MWAGPYPVKYLPVVQAEKFDFIIDVDTAKALRLKTPFNTTPPRRHGGNQITPSFATVLNDAIGTSRHFVATQQFGRFQSEADIQRAALKEPDL